MKVLIVFLGLLVINVSFLTYQGDMGRYVRCQIFLKAVAEECAAGASLYYDHAAYSEGKLIFSYEEGQKYIEYIIEESRSKMPLPEDSIMTYDVSFQDDYLGYDNSQTVGLSDESAGEEGIPSVTVVITALTDDLFRLPFLEVTEVKRAARYELPQ